VGTRAVDTVVIYDPDRFARRLSHQLLLTEEIERAGVALEFINFEWQDTPEGKLFYSMRGAIAEYEREKIRLRTTAGRLQKARTGKLPFAMAPYGYRYDKERQVITPYEPEATVVCRIFEDLSRHARGLNGIAHQLTADGIPTSTGRSRWHRQVVRQIARNPVYSGVYYANRRDMTGVGQNPYRTPGEKVWGTIRDREQWIPVTVPAIVDVKTWRAAQAAMDRKADIWKQAARSRYLLSGLLRCGLCGQTMTGARDHNWGKYVPEYRCRKTTAGARHPGCGHRVRAADLDTVLWEQVVAWLQEPALLAERLQPRLDAKKLVAEIAETDAALEQIRTGQRRLLQVLEGQLADSDDVLDRLNRLKQRENVIRMHRDQLGVALREAGGALPNPEALAHEARQILARVSDELPFEERRLIVRQFVVSIVVGTDTLTVRAKCPDHLSQASLPDAKEIAVAPPR
ncbi:MAG: recombinase family protein, partial [Clostridia bacterium]